MITQIICLRPYLADLKKGSTKDEIWLSAAPDCFVELAH